MSISKAHHVNFRKHFFPQLVRWEGTFMLCLIFFFFKEILKKEKKRMRYNKMSNHKEIE